jgi:LmbE family N-acetylglucosaminyl deacetylase
VEAPQVLAVAVIAASEQSKMNDSSTNWDKKKRILVILAHPDDPDFFCGATLAAWCKLGHEVHYCLLTKGQKGSQDVYASPAELGKLRVEEQTAAAAAIGVKTVEFLDYMDGEVIPDLEMRKKIVRVIRRWQPDILVTCDPLNLFPSDNRINHPDHRAAGQAVVDAAFPAAGSPMFFPELILDEKLPAHNVDEIWLSATVNPNLQLDVTESFEDKLRALHCHRSQIGEIGVFDKNMRSRWIEDPETGQKRFFETFRRIILQ